MNRPIRNLAVACLVLFLALIANASYLQFFEADSLTSLSENPRNSRVSEAAFAAPRGDILVNGKAIASSEPSGDRYEFQRVYKSGPEYANVVGFFGRGLIGGLEASQNDYLTGEAPELFVNRLGDLLTNKPPAGGNVVLTLNAKAQKAAYQALGELGKNVRAAAVAIEPKTGKILAMVSNPGFNPAALASHDFAKARAAYDRLKPDSRTSPLNNVAIEEALPPGSTFKLVTAAAALSSGDYQPDTLVDGSRILDFRDTTSDLGNHNGQACGPNNKVTLIRALEISCNVAFASVGIKVGQDALRQQAEKFGFNAADPYFTDLDDSLTKQSTSVFPSDIAAVSSLGYSSIGQFSVAATPLQMAMVAAGIANDGKVMKPYLVNEIRSADLDVVKSFDKELYSQAVSPSVADQLTSMMVSVVDNGTGSNAQIPGVQVAGKTGTAQTGVSGQKPYAWFVSFAPADDPEVAVAVVVMDTAAAARRGCGADVDCEGGISGNEMAAPIARAVMEAVVNQ
ncbi:MAG: penicillin-binding protein 2 [Propionibacteriales bacterium]|nr:penicillin-binding protein 2 [Propionibacteriales bacterium]